MFCRGHGEGSITRVIAGRILVGGSVIALSLGLLRR